MKEGNGMNPTIFQFFHWYFPPEDKLWVKCAESASQLEELGVTHVWLPPAYKSSKGNQETGYAVYDFYDLGEFDQKGSVATKHGTKEQYLRCVAAFHDKQIKVLADIVMNHLFEGDFEEEVPVVEVSERNRNRTKSSRKTIKAKTGFGYPARAGKYSNFVWDHQCFTGVMHEGKINFVLNEYTHEGWEHLADKERGSFDFLMANDIEFRNPEVRKELLRWGQWYVKTTGVDGFRIDALKHIPPDFFPQWLDHLSVLNNKDFFSIGEYWKDDVGKLVHFLRLVSRRIRLFDVPLHFNLYRASTDPGFDLRKIFDGSLVEAEPDSAITFVDNHDTQPLQSLESTVEEWFQPHAYALILLREAGIPCVFYPAVFGASYSDEKEGKKVAAALPESPAVKLMMKLRRNLRAGVQADYFDNKHLIGWTRIWADEKTSNGLVVVLSTKKEGSIVMKMGEEFAGKTFFDITGSTPGTVILDKKGSGKFYVDARKAAVWIPVD